MPIDYSKITKWKDKTIQGSTFPDSRYRWDVNISLEKEIRDEYIPALKTFGLKKGFELLLIAMTDKEGFWKGTRSYRTKNPGNIGNTDSGANRPLASLKDGISLQINFIRKIISGKEPNYPMGKRKVIKPYYSPEIAKNANTYKMSPWLPGYDFVFTGQLDQYVKIYSTGSRGANGYINGIMSFFRVNGLDIFPDSKIQDIIEME